MPTELEELTEFLHSDQPAVVQIALGNLVGYSLGPQKQVFAYNNYEAIKDLKKLSKEQGKTTVTQSVSILVNLCDDAQMRRLLVEDRSYLTWLVTSIVRPTNINADIMSILLANLAKDDLITAVFNITLDLSKDEEKVFALNKAMDCLMDCFVKGFDRALNKYANYDYLAYVFSDISRFEVGRNYFTAEQSYDQVVPISKLLVFTEKYDSKIRREGAAFTIKNSLFDVDSHYKLVHDENINILPFILLPITGPEEIEEDDMFNLPDELQLLPEDKQREPLDAILCTHLESLLLLCTRSKIREHLRAKSVYPLVRELHKKTSSEEVAALCDRVVQLLMRDEAEKEADKGAVIENENENENENEDDNDNNIVEIL